MAPDHFFGQSDVPSKVMFGYEQNQRWLCNQKIFLLKALTCVVKCRYFIKYIKVSVMECKM